MNIYLTADQVGLESGGGIVTLNESQALAELGDCEVWDRKSLEGIKDTGGEPWKWDMAALVRLALNPDVSIELVHGYAGTFTDSIAMLKRKGVRTCWTVAAHDLQESIAEHIKICGHYPFTHMSDPVQFERYKRGYLEADMLVCPSSYSADIMRKYGRTGPITVIPHGVHLPEKVEPLPKQFRVGFLGALGPDKGILYLLQAWKKLNYKDALLMIAGKQSTEPQVVDFVKHHGGGNIQLCGWVNNVSDFYNQISVLAVPSVSEGFNIECLESLAHSRPVICSQGAGASELIYRDKSSCCGRVFQPRDVDELIGCLDLYKSHPDMIGEDGVDGKKVAEKHTWQIIRKKYQELWKGMLND